MKFCWCTITVNNMEESLRFYQQMVGLNVNRRFNAGPDTEIAFLGEGETEVELIYNKNKKASGKKEDISLGFVVTSPLENMIQHVKEKGLEATEVYQPNPHIRFFYVYDPNGVKIQFVENI